MIDFRLETKCLFSSLLLIACGPGSIPEQEAFDCVDANTLCVTLNIPDSYDGEPRELATAFYDTNDTNRPPNETLPAIETPTIVPGESYELSHEGLDFEGEFYVMFVLYDEAGGLWVPESDIDYVATTPTAVWVDSNPLQVGELSLELAD